MPTKELNQTKTINLSSITNSRVLVRVNFDIPDLTSIQRIKDAIPTIKLLLAQGNKVILLTHIARPTGWDNNLSVQRIAILLEKTIHEELMYLNQFASFEAVKEIFDGSNKKLFLMENTRFSPDENSSNSNSKLELAKEYAQFADYFVDEAFAVSHRDEATNSTLKKILPYSYGISYNNELTNLNRLKTLLHSTDPKNKPSVVVMGGAKLETKLALVNKILPSVDYILIGGMLSFTFIQAQNELNLKTKVDIADSKVETEFLATAKSILIKHHNKVILPIDYNFATENSKKLALDIGPESIQLFSNHIKNAKVLLWNGPLGYCEKEAYATGTMSIAKAISENKDCYRVVGGGDTLAFLPDNLEAKFDFVSMGGGATLEFLSK
jgi:phosphoglycerate kinase